MPIARPDTINILLVDDQPAKLLSYEVILAELGETLIKAGSAREALGHLLKTDVAVVLIDVCMPELDGFELATMIREHPRFQKIAIIFVSAIQITEFDRLRGYEAGAVDYVPVPVVPEVLRAKVKVFVELHRKTRQLEALNAELEQRVVERTAALEASAAQLQQSEQRRSLALAAGHMGSWEWDLVTGDYLWDAGQYRIVGLDPDSFRPTSQSVTPLIHPDDFESVRLASLQAVETGNSYCAEFRIVRADGETRWCIAIGSSTRDDLGKPVRLSGVTHDITERKLGEEALKRLNEELEGLVEERTREREVALAQLFEAQKIETIGHLTGGVAHDFNNLLMAVLGSLELLQKRLPSDDARSRRLLDNALQGAERGAALTQRLLAFARRQELKPETVDVAGLIHGMQDLLERSVGPGIVTSVAIPADLPPVLADANQLELALLNLVVNARDAMPSGGSLSIVARAQAGGRGDDSVSHLLPSGSYVAIEVADTGIGMDEATLARATEPFFTTKGVGKGTGLGLSMVHGLAAQSGGALGVTSREGQGTTVRLWLPQADRSATLASLTDASPVQGAPAGQSAVRLRILIVDDDHLVRAGTVAMLEDLNHIVVEAENGVEALAAISDRDAHIDLVITDHAMPNMTGLEMIRLLETSHPALPVILASGYADIAQDADPGRFPRLSKPFRQSDLANAISVAVERGRTTPGTAMPLCVA